MEQERTDILIITKTEQKGETSCKVTEGRGLATVPTLIALPLQNEWRIGLAVMRVVDMDGVSAVGSELTKCSLAATHSLCQAAARTGHA